MNALFVVFQVENMDEMPPDPFMDVGFLNGSQDMAGRGRGGPGRGRGGPPPPLGGARWARSFLVLMRQILQGC